MLREVTTLSRFHHQHIVRYYQAWIDGSSSVTGDLSSSSSSDLYSTSSQAPTDEVHNRWCQLRRQAFHVKRDSIFTYLTESQFTRFSIFVPPFRFWIPGYVYYEWRPRKWYVITFTEVVVACSSPHRANIHIRWEANGRVLGMRLRNGFLVFVHTDGVLSEDFEWHDIWRHEYRWWRSIQQLAGTAIYMTVPAHTPVPDQPRGLPSSGVLRTRDTHRWKRYCFWVDVKYHCARNHITGWVVRWMSQPQSCFFFSTIFFWR